MDSDHAPALDYARPSASSLLARFVTGLLITTGLLLVFIILIWWGSSVSERIIKSRIRSESIRLLSNAPDFETRKSMVNEGGWASFGDGGWIVIRYSCAHCSRGGDTAIALDSAGRWYESSRHFCGSLGLMNRDSLPKDGLAGTAATQPAETPPSIETIGLCPDLGSARAVLLAAGFKPLSRPSPFRVSSM